MKKVLKREYMRILMSKQQNLLCYGKYMKLLWKIQIRNFKKGIWFFLKI